MTTASGMTKHNRIRKRPIRVPATRDEAADALGVKAKQQPFHVLRLVVAQSARFRRSDASPGPAYGAMPDPLKWGETSRSS